MNNKVKFVFIKRSGCPFCNKFMPIFDKLLILLKKVSDDKNMNLEIKIYDVFNENENENFKNENKHLYNWTKGVPSMFIDCLIDNVVTFDPIEPIYPVSNNDEEINKAAQQIFNIFIYKYKIFTLQLGGNNNLYYKNKYLKYKNKYLLLKNNN